MTPPPPHLHVGIGVWGAENYDIITTFYDFLPHPHHLLQDFCKKAQWRAKKLRERGSNAARPPKKGGGGSPDWSQPVAIGRNRSQPVVIGRNRS